MEDEKIKELFSRFEPEVSSEFEFMKRVERNLEAVEIVKQHNRAMMRQSRRAVVVAALCGFAAGVVMMMILPVIIARISALAINLPGDIAVDYNIVVWTLTAGVCALSSLGAYEIAMSRPLR